MLDVIRPAHTDYSPRAKETFAELDARVARIFDLVQDWRGWTLLESRESPPESILALIREILFAVASYQAHTTEAGFHMFGRLPKGEVKLMQALSAHKAEEAEHGLWAREDFASLGGDPARLDHPPSPATFAVAGVWWRIAQVEDPFGYIGAEYLFEKLTALVTQAAVPIIRRRKLPTTGLRFVIAHATEDEKHATFFKHLILDAITRHPDRAGAMLRCFDYFHAVYPLPVWDEAFGRATQLRN